jgi:hypothetical protein
MAITIQLRRDTETNMNSVTPAQGELLLATDTHKAVIGDGSGDTFQAMVTANKFFNFEDGDGGRVFGGNDANETITVRGGSSQTNPIFKVTTNNTSNSIVEIYDDTQLVKIDATHGATGDKTLLLKAKASQTGSVIEVQDSSSTDARFKVLEDGQTTITPNDTTSPSLDVKGSGGSQSNGILRVQDNSGNAEFTVSDGGATVTGTLGVTGETTATGGIKVDDITENTADHGVAIAKPITVTGNINATDGSKLLIQNHASRIFVTQTAAQTTVGFTEANDGSGVAALSAVKLSDLAVAITPTSTDSKILIEASVTGCALTSRPEMVLATIVRTIGASDTDLAGDNTSASGDGGTSGTVKALAAPGSTTGVSGANQDIDGFMHYDVKFLDSPSTTSECTYTFGIKSANDVSASRSFTLNKNEDGRSGSAHFANTISLIKVTEIPQ